MPYIDDLSAPQIRAADVCSAAGIDMNTFKNWISRSRRSIVIPLAPEERRGEGERTFLQLTLRSAYHVALVAELVKRGHEPRHAHEIAAAFSMFGDGNREPGSLFADGYTYLVGAVEAGASYVRQVQPRATLVEVTHDAEAHGGGVSALIRVDPIVWRVRAALGLPARPGSDA